MYLNHAPRRGLLTSVALLLQACAGANPPPPDPPPKAGVAQYGRRALGETGIVVHALRAGWVRVKAAHRELSGLAALRVPAIIFDSDWAGWMPIIVYAIERPDGGIVLVDAGASPRINDDDYFACNERNGWFYRRNLRFDVDGPDDASLVGRLEAAGLDPKRVTHVVVTHFHADHVGGLADLRDAKIMVGPGNWPEHVGSATCEPGPGWSVTLASYPDGAFGAFDRSETLGDPRVRMIPLPGHTPGHAGVLVEAGGEAWVFAGDATFDPDQTERGAICGATQDVDDAYETQAKLREGITTGKFQLLPAHDPAAFARLGAP